MNPLRWAEFDGDDGIRAMCDHGAAEVAAGTYDAVRFSIMASEADAVRRYMAARHPSVAFSLTWPVGLTAQGGTDV